MSPAIPRTVRRLVVALALLAVVLGASFLSYRTGRHYEYNKMCCQVPRQRNLVLSAREALGLVCFPSQIGQDRWVAESVFPDVRNGYFLDVGSADGYVNTNTWALEQRGWTGICIDPFPSGMEGRNCQMFPDVVGAEAGQKVSFVQAGEIGGITDHLGKRKDATKGAKTVELVTVTLGDILERAKAPAFIHFMSLDIEGAELEALKGFPFEKYRLGAIALEHNDEEPKRTEIERLLNSKGYVRVHTWMQDDFYRPRPQQQ